MTVQYVMDDLKRRSAHGGALKIRRNQLLFGILKDVVDVDDFTALINFNRVNLSWSLGQNSWLLQKFVEKHRHGLQVIYSLSGWLKSNPQIYHIRLVSGLKLEEVKREFEDGCSVQVYSIQAGILKDPAVLWSAEFVQSEELFNQPATFDNCLRDNRFCGVSNSFVKRSVDGKSITVTATATALRSKSGFGVTMLSKYDGIIKSSSAAFPQQEKTQNEHSKILPSSHSSIVTDGEKGNTVQEVGAPISNSQHGKEDITSAHADQKKGHIQKTSSGRGGSLANLWDRASAKPQPLSPSMETSSDAPKTIFTADAQICARETMDIVSSDEEGHNVNYKRDSKGRNGRKRRVVLDSSDEDIKDENAMSLASPGFQKEQLATDSTCNAKNLTGKGCVNLEEQKSTKLEIKTLKEAGTPPVLLPKDDSEGALKNKTGWVSSSEKVQSHFRGATDKNKKEILPNSVSTSPKPRKLLKTCIDERGREVSEIIWEGEPADSGANEKKAATINGENRLPAANKAPGDVHSSSISASTNILSKAGSKKTAKGGAKDPKQGNILSFFKKMLIRNILRL
ncbi:hypothetical protein QJS04_geneDACA014317 [Acorus gramineus]|uniref:DNA polymerase delta subunit 3 n=1 Tax=Acorus gramineus TaxID=55184 RepID=A0AAV9A150_ACOGR|nr:hypothetical protein QJS04_geneDACA014317 [Acorus gramineus]